VVVTTESLNGIVSHRRRRGTHAGSGRRIRQSSAIQTPMGHATVDGDVALKIAASRGDLFEAFHLVYRAYVRAGLATPNSHRMRVTAFHSLSTTEVFVAKKGDAIVCTMSLVADGKLGLPMECVYADEVMTRRLRGRRLAEVSCLADDHESTGGSCRIVMRLMSLMAQCAKLRGVDELVIAVHPRHAKFYERCAAFMPIGDVRTYHGVCDNPAVAMVLDLNRVSQTHPMIWARFFGNPYPAETIRRRPIPKSLREELREMTDIRGVGLRFEEQLTLACA
jgi:hypothetical protein